MDYKIQFEASLIETFNENKTYYHNISPKLSKEYEIEFWNKIDYIKQYPLQHSIRYRKIRIAILK